MENSLSLIIDVVVIVLIIMSAVLAMVRGFVREMFALVSWIAAFFAALFLAPIAKPLLTKIPGVGDLLKSCDVLAFVSFIVVFGIALIIAGLVFYLFSGPTRNSSAGVLNQGLGFMYGAIRGLVLVAVVFIAYVKIVPQPDSRSATPPASVTAPEGAARAPLPKVDPTSHVGKTYTLRFVRPVAEFLWSKTPKDMPEPLRRRAEELTGNCK
ncbi:MAG: CvpA family protein [Neomegalonema sp.]|nr:CvpA family protein [Neomegalonema sp.]